MSPATAELDSFTRHLGECACLYEMHHNLVSVACCVRFVGVLGWFVAMFAKANLVFLCRHGVEDFVVCQQHNIPAFSPVRFLCVFAVVALVFFSILLCVLCCARYDLDLALGRPAFVSGESCFAGG